MADTQTHASSSATPHTAKSLLLQDHHALAQHLTQLTCALEGGDPGDVAEVWTQFERSLRDHIDTEERCLFPLVASAHRTEIEQLRLEHQRIRCAMGELGVAVDLHALRKASVDELVLYLLAHAAREEHSLYQWVDDMPTAQRGIQAMFTRRATHGSRVPRE